MKPSLLKYSAWISLLALLSACSAPRVILNGGDDLIPGVLFLQDSANKTIARATVIYKETELSGRILIKKDNEGNYRVAFYNEMGMTYLEGTLEKETGYRKLNLNTIMPALDHRIFIRRFEKSLRDNFFNSPQSTRSYTEYVTPQGTRSYTEYFTPQSTRSYTEYVTPQGTRSYTEYFTPQSTRSYTE